MKQKVRYWQETSCLFPKGCNQLKDKLTPPPEQPHCPVCSTLLDFEGRRPKFCPECGQELDWNGYCSRQKVVCCTCCDDPRDKFILGIVISITEEDRADDDPLSLIREAAADFLRSDEGRRVLRRNSGAFNFGDFIDYVPPELCEVNGFRIDHTFVTDIIAEHNEQLTAAGDEPQSR